MAEPLTEAVAPVKIRVGGFAEVGREARRRGRRAWEKWKAPLLEGGRDNQPGNRMMRGVRV